MRQLILLFLLGSLLTPCQAMRDPQIVVNEFNTRFNKIKDATTDVTLDTSLQILGCNGLTRFKGKGFFKAPDKFKVTLNNTTYFVRGNDIRKIDENGKRYYVKLINALDFSPGFNPQLIPHNFYLKMLKDDADDIVIEGLPKPGILKNVTKVLLHFDAKLYLLRQLDLTLINKKKPEYIYIEYQQIGGIWTPVGFHGRSAIELRAGILIGLDIKLKGENFKLNSGLNDQLFAPGF